MTNAAENKAAHDRVVAALRRQVDHANRWRDTAIGEANEARAEAAELRRQLEATQAEMVALRKQLADMSAEAAKYRRAYLEAREMLLEIGTAAGATEIDSPEAILRAIQENRAEADTR